MATYTIAYHIASALISSDDSGLTELEVEQLNRWLEFQGLENVRLWESAIPYNEHYPNEGFYDFCNITEGYYLCDEVRPETEE